MHDRKMLSQHKCGGYDAGEVTATYSQEKGWSWKTGDDSCRTSVHNLFIAKAEKHATVSKNVLLSKEKRVKKKKEEDANTENNKRFCFHEWWWWRSFPHLCGFGEND